MYTRKRIHPLIRIATVIIALVVLVILIGRLDFPGWVMRVLSGIVPEGSSPAYTADEVEELRDRVGNLESENSFLREMVMNLQESADLRDIEPVAGNEILVAQVIYRDHARVFETAIINRGASDGVEPGMPVVDANGLVGRVISARAAVSRIELVTSSDSSFGVINQRSRELGIVRGSTPISWGARGGSGDELPPDILVLEYLSPSADISVDDTLVTSGLSGITPPGIRVGLVVEIISRAEQDRFDIRIKPFADLDHLATVAVVLYYEEERSQMEELVEEAGGIIGPPESGEIID